MLLQDKIKSLFKGVQRFDIADLNYLIKTFKVTELNLFTISDVSSMREIYVYQTTCNKCFIKDNYFNTLGLKFEITEIYFNKIKNNIMTLAVLGHEKGSYISFKI